MGKKRLWNGFFSGTVSVVPRERTADAGTSGFVVCLAATEAVVDEGRTAAFEDAELSVDVDDSVLAERVADGFFGADAVVGVPPLDLIDCW